MSRSEGKLRRRRAPIMAPGPVVAAEPLGCIKVPYDDEAAARMENPRQHPYLCRLCRRWHTTRRLRRR